MILKKTLLTLTAAAGMMAAGTYAANADTVTVQSGDTVSKIANEHNVTVPSIEAANKLTNVNMIYVRKKLEVGSTEAAQPATPAQTPAPAPQQNQAAAANKVQQPVQKPAKKAVQQPAKPANTATPKQNSGNSSEAAAKAAIAARESGGSYSASNGNYYGKYQLTKSTLNGDLSEANQEKTADAYVSARYGSWANALQHSNQNGWY